MLYTLYAQRLQQQSFNPLYYITENDWCFNCKGKTSHSCEGYIRQDLYYSLVFPLSISHISLSLVSLFLSQSLSPPPCISVYLSASPYPPILVYHHLMFKLNPRTSIKMQQKMMIPGESCNDYTTKYSLSTFRVYRYTIKAIRLCYENLI